jgi:thiol-disulfide isomerase/thioredoxin
LIAISPNSPNGLLYEELGYSDLSDTYEEMIIRAKDKSYNFPYLYDGDDEKVSLKYGPVATPHVFVFDKERVLRYHGRIDNSQKPGTAKAEDLSASIDSLLEGNQVATAITKTFGCSTKWGWKTEQRIKTDKEWDNRKVTLEEIDQNGITTLIQNNTEKLRLINIWATWCGPCRLEYPSFIPIQRMFGARDFEFISISMDEVGKKESAKKFLQKSNSAVTNYISTIEDKYEFIELIDSNWNGALPYTLVIEPDGNIYWSHQGEIDFQNLKKVIVEHPKIGRFY